MQTINKTDPLYSTEEIETAIEESTARGSVWAKCNYCGKKQRVEPDAEGYGCKMENCHGELTSPLRAEGLI